MKVTVFGKKRTTKEGKVFTSYLGKVTKKTGEKITVQVKFREECGFPKTTPCVINFDKKDANFSEKERTYTDNETQEEKKTIERILWVSNFKEEKFVDTSMDEFE